ncbi:MAG TPA: MarR family transcriptional regulator [Caulobacteraceae bacterium]|jgi:DNA-binding MarR family transcriptional regulator
MREQTASAATAQAHELAAELRVLFGALSRRIRERAQLDGLSNPQKAVLLRLESGGPSTVSDLARAEGVKPQSIGETVAALRAAGLVEAAPDPADGRKTLLSMAHAARQRALVLRAAHDDWLFGILETRFTPQEREQLRDAIDLLHRFVQP